MGQAFIFLIWFGFSSSALGQTTIPPTFDVPSALLRLESPDLKISGKVYLELITAKAEVSAFVKEGALKKATALVRVKSELDIRSALEFATPILVSIPLYQRNFDSLQEILDALPMDDVRLVLLLRYWKAHVDQLRTIDWTIFLDQVLRRYRMPDSWQLRLVQIFETYRFSGIAAGFVGPDDRLNAAIAKDAQAETDAQSLEIESFEREIILRPSFATRANCGSLLGRFWDALKPDFSLFYNYPFYL